MSHASLSGLCLRCVDLSCVGHRCVGRRCVGLRGVGLRCVGHRCVAATVGQEAHGPDPAVLPLLPPGTQTRQASEPESWHFWCPYMPLSPWGGLFGLRLGLLSLVLGLGNVLPPNPRWSLWQEAAPQPLIVSSRASSFPTLGGTWGRPELLSVTETPHLRRPAVLAQRG